MKKTFIIIFMIASFIYGGYAVYTDHKRNAESEQSAKTDSEEIVIGGEFNLLNQDGVNTSSKDLDGKFKVIFFGFTNCPEICPVGLDKLTEAVLAMDDKLRAKITPVFITVDPERDNPEAVKNFIEGYDIKFTGLTGTSEQIADVVKKYRIYVSKVNPEGVENPETAMDYNMDHSAYIYIMDEKNEFLNVVSSNETTDEIKKRISDAILSK